MADNWFTNGIRSFFSPAAAARAAAERHARELQLWELELWGDQIKAQLRAALNEAEADQLGVEPLELEVDSAFTARDHDALDRPTSRERQPELDVEDQPWAARAEDVGDGIEQQWRSLCETEYRISVRESGNDGHPANDLDTSDLATRAEDLATGLSMVLGISPVDLRLHASDAAYAHGRDPGTDADPDRFALPDWLRPRAPVDAEDGQTRLAGHGVAGVDAPVSDAESTATEATAGDTYWAHRAVDIGPEAAERERLADEAQEAAYEAELVAERAQRAREVDSAAAVMTTAEAGRIIEADRAVREHTRGCNQDVMRCDTCAPLEMMDGPAVDAAMFDLEVANRVLAAAPAEVVADALATGRAAYRAAERASERAQDLRELVMAAENDLLDEADDAVERFQSGLAAGLAEDVARQEAVRAAAAAAVARRGERQTAGRDLLEGFPQTAAQAREALRQAAVATATAEEAGAGTEVARARLDIAALEYALIRLQTRAGGDTAAWAIALLQEYRDSHGYDPTRARAAALADISQGAQSTKDVANHEAQDFHAEAIAAVATTAAGEIAGVTSAASVRAEQLQEGLRRAEPPGAAAATELAPDAEDLGEPHPAIGALSTLTPLPPGGGGAVAPEDLDPAQGATTRRHLGGPITPGGPDVAPGVIVGPGPWDYYPDPEAHSPAAEPGLVTQEPHPAMGALAALPPPQQRGHATPGLSSHRSTPPTAGLAHRVNGRSR